MAKKTVTIDLTFKRWMKLALLALAFLFLSYLFMNGAHAQGTSFVTSSGTISSISSGSSVLQLDQRGNLIAAQPKVETDPTFRQVWFAVVSVLFLLGTFFTTLGAIASWHNKEE